MVEIRLELTVRDLTLADLPQCTWSGSITNLAHVASELERAGRGGVDYLAVCTPANMPVAIGGVDYELDPAVGRLWQLEVHPALRSCGIGAVLIEAAESRIQSRGLRRAEILGPDDNTRLRTFYERLGYSVYDRQQVSTQHQSPDGLVRRTESLMTVFRKDLAVT